MTVDHSSLLFSVPLILINLDANVSDKRNIRVKFGYIFIKIQLTIFGFLLPDARDFDEVFFSWKTFLSDSFHFVRNEFGWQVLLISEDFKVVQVTFLTRLTDPIGKRHKPTLVIEIKCLIKLLKKACKHKKGNDSSTRPSFSMIAMNSHNVVFVF